jgi:hypothetical protein
MYEDPAFFIGPFVPVGVSSNAGMYGSHSVVNLFGCKAKEQAHGKHDSKCLPIGNWRKGLKVVHISLLAAAYCTEPCF